MTLVTRILPIVALALAAAAVALSSTADASSAKAANTQVVAYFTRGEHLAPVRRDAADSEPLAAALAALVAGPSADEHRRGIRTSIPAGTVFGGVSVEDGVAFVELSAQFTAGPRSSLFARLAQVVFTATASPGVEAVRITIDGKPLFRLGALALDEPSRRSDFAEPAQGGGPPVASPPPVKPSALVLAIQRRLVELRYLRAGEVDGIAGERTRHAILAFQGWERVPRDGRPTPRLRQLLDKATQPRPRASAGRRIEVSLERQVAIIVDAGRVVRTIHVSTGAPASPTPRGTYQVFRKELRSWSVPFRVWLPYASYFTGGIAFHESPDVPAYAASHGCVRVASHDAPFVYAFARTGTRVVVF